MNPAPKWFAIAAFAALAWNLLGCAAIAMDLMLTADDVLKLPAEQQALYDARPGWAVGGSVLAVVAGALGSLGLVLRRRWALPLLGASLGGVIVQDIGFVIMARVAPLPVSAYVMQTLVAAIAIGLLVLARHAARAGWLR